MIRRNIIKMSLCGEGGVGKTSIARRFTQSEFKKAERITVGIQHFFKKINLGSNEYMLAIWDLGGETRFRFLAPTFLRGTKALIFVFDVTREETFEKLDEWLKISLSIVGDIPRVLVGNKIDIEEFRVVPRDIAERYAKERKFLNYYEVSAKLGINIDRPFLDLLTYLIKEGVGIGPSR